MKYARDGAVLVVHTLDRSGLTVRDTLNIVHELDALGIGPKTPADPFKIDATAKDDTMNQLVLALNALPAF
nr:recombinase family protein [Arthrobacter sp. ZBG10]